MLSKHHESLWHIATSQKAWILSYTTVEISELAKNETPVLCVVHSQRMKHLFDMQYTHKEWIAHFICSTLTKKETHVLNAVHSQRMKCLFYMWYTHKERNNCWYAAHAQRMNHLFDIHYTHSEKSTQMSYSSCCSVRKELIYVKDPGSYALWKLALSSVADNFLTKISSNSFFKYYFTFFTLYVTLKISCCYVTDLLCT